MTVALCCAGVQEAMSVCTVCMVRVVTGIGTIVAAMAHVAVDAIGKGGVDVCNLCHDAIK